MVEKEPNPKEVLTVAPDSATNAEPLPTIKLPSVALSPAISFKLSAYACTSVPITTPS